MMAASRGFGAAPPGGRLPAQPAPRIRSGGTDWNIEPGARVEAVDFAAESKAGSRWTTRRCWKFTGGSPPRWVRDGIRVTPRLGARVMLVQSRNFPGGIAILCRTIAVHDSAG